MAFKSIGSLDHTNEAPLLRRYIITNSVVTTINDSVKLASGFMALGTTGALVLGHVYAIGTEKGVGVSSTGATGAEFGSFTNTYTAASNNQTVAKVKADVNISKMALYSASLDATIGTTTGSNLAGYHIDVLDEDDLSESSTTTATAQYSTHGVDPYNSSNAVVNIYESQLL